LPIIETENQSSRPNWFIVSSLRVLRLIELKLHLFVGFATSYLTVTEEERLAVFEKKNLKRISEPKGQTIKGM
jgi:hypothetical protein